MWLSLLVRFWKPLAGAALILSAGWYLHHAGYESGYAASERKWQQLFAKAASERDAANARTEKAEALSKQAVADSQRRIDETLQTLHVRAADYDSRLRSLSMRYAAASAHCSALPSAPGATSSPDATTGSVERAERAGASIAATGERCERDAARLAELQRTYTEQRTIVSEARTH